MIFRKEALKIVRIPQIMTGPEMAQPATAAQDARVASMIHEMKAAAIAGNVRRVEEVATSMGVLLSAYMSAQPVQVDDFGQAWQERRIYKLLSSRPGFTYPREAIQNAIYFDRSSGEVPEIKIVDVFVCHLRKRLKAQDANVWVENVWGVGYRLVNKRARACKVNPMHRVPAIPPPDENGGWEPPLG